MGQRIHSLGALRGAATHLRVPQGSAGEWVGSLRQQAPPFARSCAPDNSIDGHTARTSADSAGVRSHRAVSPSVCERPHGRFATKQATRSHGAKLRPCDVATRPQCRSSGHPIRAELSSIMHVQWPHGRCERTDPNPKELSSGHGRQRAGHQATMPNTMHPPTMSENVEGGGSWPFLLASILTPRFQMCVH